MTMLAEKLLLEKGFRIPHREKLVLQAMETLREPHGIVQRRKAREYLRAEIVAAGNPVTGEPFTETLPQDEHPPKGVEVFAYKMPVTTEMAMKVPEDLRFYLTPDSEPVIAYDDQVFLKALLSTGGLYRVDGGEDGAQGVLDSVFGGLPLTELPPLPFPRMWFEARSPNGDFMPLWHTTPPEGAWNAVDSAELWGLGITELVPGSSWGVIVVRKQDWLYPAPDETFPPPPKGMKRDMLTSLRYERISARDLALTPQRPEDIFGPEYDAESEGAYRGAMTAWAITLADMVTARNVDRRQTFLSRKALKQLQRAAPRQIFESRVYNVCIATATGDAKDETGNYLTVRFLVRGHWRKSRADHAQWIDAKDAHCVWVTGYVKGPAGAPWKGRAVYVEPETG